MRWQALLLALLWLAVPLAKAQDGSPIYCLINKGNHPMKATQDGWIVRVFRFTHRAEVYSVAFAVPVEYLNTLAQFDQNDRDNLAVMAMAAGLECVPVSQEVARMARQEGFGNAETAAFALALCQSLPYSTDATSLGVDEFYRLPSESVVDTEVDCEDTSLLLGGILDGLGIPYVFLTPPGHLAVGIQGSHRGWHVENGGRRFYYAETTGAGFRVGQAPPGMGRTLGLMDVSGQREQIFTARLAKDGEPIRYTARASSDPRPRPPAGHPGTARRQSQAPAWVGWLLLAVILGAVGIAAGSMAMRNSRRDDPLAEEDLRSDAALEADAERELQNRREVDGL